MSNPDVALKGLAPQREFFAAATSSAPEQSDKLWPIIWSAGGLCWLAIAIVGLLWSWPVSGTTSNGDYIVTNGARTLHHALLFLVSACAYRFSLGLGWPTPYRARLRVVIVHILIALLVVRIAPYILALSSAIVDNRWSHLSEDVDSWLPFQPSMMQWVGLLRFWMPTYVLGLIAVALVYTARQYHRESIRLAHVSAEVANLRMAMLSAQLHPHFLFNALHAISELISQSPEQAITMVARLGDFLRVALESTKRPWIRVEAEFAGLEAYLAVQQTRFRDRLEVHMSVDPAALKILMPALLLQPIVENAIEHGRCGSAGTLVVGISVRCEAQRLIVVVTNSTPQLPGLLARSAFGDGLRNVDARLRAAYGNGATMSISPDSIRGTRAELTMPATEAVTEAQRT
jgi:two-component system, LytTR family, sensor kinase